MWLKKGKILTMIARKYNISVLTLLQWNNLTFKSYIHPGDALVVGGEAGKIIPQQPLVQGFRGFL